MMLCHYQNKNNSHPCQKQSSGGVLKKVILKNFAKFTGIHLCQSLFFNKVTDTACNFNIEEALAQVFYFTKFLRTIFFKEHLQWRLLSSCFYLRIFCLSACQESLLRFFSSQQFGTNTEQVLFVHKYGEGFFKFVMLHCFSIIYVILIILLCTSFLTFKGNFHLDAKATKFSYKQ